MTMAHATEFTPSPELIRDLNKTKAALMSRKDSVFFTTIIFSLKFKWDTSQPTAWTDGVYMAFNPNFFQKMNQEERVGVMVHEAMHVAYMHMARLGTRDQRVFNAAADHVINLQLLERGFKLPVPHLADPKYKGMSTEEVYKLIMQELQANPQKQPQLSMEDLRSPELEKEKQEGKGDKETKKQSGNGDPEDGQGEGDGQSSTPKGMSEADFDEHLKNIVMRAAIQSKMAGEKPGAMPGDIEIMLDKLLNPELPWTRILSKYLNSFSKNDYTWKRPNRRHFPDHHLPSLYSESLIDMAVAVDISGSVSDGEFTRFVSEIAQVFRMMKPKKITLIQFDTRLQHIDEIHSLQELLKVKFTGRGGTCVKPVMQWATEHKPQLLMFFTDGFFDMPALEAKPKRTDVLWLIHNNKKRWAQPFGKTIHYNIE